MRCRLLLTALVLTSATAWAQAPNLLTNPGFEGSGTAMNGWYCPDYWSGQATVVTAPEAVHNGTRAWQIAARPKNNDIWGRIHAVPQPVTPGLRYRLSVWARGTGPLKLGVIQYQRQYPEGTQYHYLWSEPATLTDQWQQFSYEFSLVHDDVQTAAAVFEVRGENALMTVDDAALTVLRPAAGNLTVEPPYQMVTVGQPVQLAVTAAVADKPLAGKTVFVLQSTPTGNVRREVALDDQGRATLSLPPLAAESQQEPQRLQVVAPEVGLSGSAYVDAVSAAMRQEFADLAQQTKLPSPTHLLFLGDSLSDFYRGYNYVDQVGYWLRQVHGNGLTVKNAGVGGDYITRVWQRLQGDPKVYRLEAYGGLLEPKPQRIFIFLGHNDSKESSASNFTQSNVSPEDYVAVFRQVLDHLKQHTGAVFTLLSPTSSVYEITKANADKTVAAGKPASLFGRPETMDRYTELTRQIAQDSGCRYLDVYTPTKTHPDKPSLFTADGVHINLAGNRLIAREILKSLAQ